MCDGSVSLSHVPTLASLPNETIQDSVSVLRTIVLDADDLRNCAKAAITLVSKHWKSFEQSSLSEWIVTSYHAHLAKRLLDEDPEDCEARDRLCTLTKYTRWFRSPQAPGREQ